MANLKIPTHFEKYLDEKFAHTNDKIDVVDKKVNGVQKELKRMNGDLSETQANIRETKLVRKQLVDTYVPKVNDNTKRSKDNEKRIRKVVVIGITVMISGSIFWIKESRDAIILPLIRSLLLALGGL